jgi:hypothetical protein
VLCVHLPLEGQALAPAINQQKYPKPAGDSQDRVSRTLPENQDTQVGSRTIVQSSVSWALGAEPHLNVSSNVWGIGFHERSRKKEGKIGAHHFWPPPHASRKPCYGRSNPTGHLPTLTLTLLNLTAPPSAWELLFHLLPL